MLGLDNTPLVYMSNIINARELPTTSTLKFQ